MKVVLRVVFFHITDLFFSKALVRSGPAELEHLMGNSSSKLSQERTTIFFTPYDRLKTDAQGLCLQRQQSEPGGKETWTSPGLTALQGITFSRG